MADKKSPESTEEEADGGKSRLIIIVAMCVAIAGGGFMIGGRMSGGGAEEETAVATEDTVEPEPVIEAIVDLEAINVNLANGHYLRIAIALGLSEVPEAEGGHGGGDDGPPIEIAPASDLVLTTFSGRTIEDLETPEGRELARKDMLHGLENYYGESIIAVMFTEFVMQ